MPIRGGRGWSLGSASGAQSASRMVDAWKEGREWVREMTVSLDQIWEMRKLSV